MKRLLIFILFINFFGLGILHAQLTIAIADFKNQSGEFYLDDWERSIPEFLKSELSSSDKIVIVERRHLEDVLQEQALSMTGLVDSSTAQKVGNMLGAQFVLTGTINKTGGWTRIDAKIIKVSTGQVRSEMVRAEDEDYLNEMIELLANNIRYTLVGEVAYREKIELSQYPTTYLLIAAAGLTIGTVVANNAYLENLDKYDNTTAPVSKFDENYDAANKMNKTRIVLASLAGAALIGTLYCWISNFSPDEILALKERESSKVIPNLVIDQKGKVQAGVSIYF